MASRNVPDEFDPIGIAIDIGGKLERLGVPWVAGGSIASSMHGEPRATNDVDLVVALRINDVKPLVSTMGLEYYIDADAVRDAVGDASSFNAVHFDSSIKADFFVAGDNPFEAERLAQRQRVDMPNGFLYVDTAEHTLLRKLEWYRRCGETSERQWRDVQAIARIQGDRLDRVRLGRWAEHLGVTDLLRRLLP